MLIAVIVMLTMYELLQTFSLSGEYSFGRCKACMAYVPLFEKRWVEVPGRRGERNKEMKNSAKIGEAIHRGIFK